MGDHRTDGWSNGVGWSDSHSSDVLNNRIQHVHRSLSGLVEGNVNAVSGEPEDIAILNVQVFAGEEADAVDSGADSVDPEVAENHNVTGTSLDYDSIGAADQHWGNLASATVNGNGFGDSDCAVSSRI